MERPPTREKWIEDRMEVLLNAIIDYRCGKYIVPTEWFVELAEHAHALEMHRQMDDEEDE